VRRNLLLLPRSKPRGVLGSVVFLTPLAGLKMKSRLPMELALPGYKDCTWPRKDVH
jgi:hypothetical protein